MIPQIKEIWIQNYKSIEKARVTLEPFTVLVGTNGTGKSNFIDALEFVKDCVTENIASALGIPARGNYVHCHSKFTPQSDLIGVRLLIELSDEVYADYGFQIGVNVENRIYVARERCIVRNSDQEYKYEIDNGNFITPISGIRPSITPGRLVLPIAASIEDFRVLNEFICAMRFYSILPHKMRRWQQKESGEFLKKDGSNAVYVYKRIAEESDKSSMLTERIERLLGLISTGTLKLGTTGFGLSVESPKEANSSRELGSLFTLRFTQDFGGNKTGIMHAEDMSDGTLRALGILLAVYQAGNHSVIAIEEPEATIHPAASEVLFQVLQDAAHDRQILITTHSADLLDNKDVSAETIRVVGMEHGRTFILPVSEGGKSSIRDHLFTAGELLRVDELNPNISAKSGIEKDFDLFDEPFKTGKERE